MIRSTLFAAQGVAAGDELTGAADLLEAQGISQRIYNHAVSKLPGNYWGGVVGPTTLYKGPGTELLPLAGIFASSMKPDFRPLHPAVLCEAFRLREGTCALAEAEKGTPVDSAALSGPAVVETAGAPAEGHKPKKEKRKKERKEKDKKRKRSPAA